jgi:Domain of unknown function (DUF4062)
LLAQIRSDAFSSRIISALVAIERNTSALARVDQRRGAQEAGGLSAAPGEEIRWRVFISHTSELREFPKGYSYMTAVERAISAAGHVIVDMKDFPASTQPPAELCAERVRGCDVYVGVLGTRYGSLVPDKLLVSYTELEFDIATESRLPRLMFLLDTAADNVGIPVSSLIDAEFGGRQAAFRRRVQDSGLVTQSFTDPSILGQLVERSLRELAYVGFGGEKDPGKDPTRDVETSNPKLEGLLLRFSTTTLDGESHNIEIFDSAIAEHWIMNYLRGRIEPPGVTDEK